jgi:hypothetical protein
MLESDITASFHILSNSSCRPTVVLAFDSSLMGCTQKVHHKDSDFIVDKAVLFLVR